MWWSAEKAGRGAGVHAPQAEFTFRTYCRQTLTLLDQRGIADRFPRVEPSDSGREVRPTSRIVKGGKRMSSYVLGFQDIDKTKIMVVGGKGRETWGKSPRFERNTRSRWLLYFHRSL